MESSFSANCGSLLTLNVRTKWGFRPCLCQIRCTLFSLMPLASAMVRVLQWVALSGFACVVLRTTSSILLAVIGGLRSPSVRSADGRRIVGFISELNPKVAEGYGWHPSGW